MTVFHSGHLFHLPKLSSQPYRGQKTLIVVNIFPATFPATFFSTIFSDADHIIRSAKRRFATFLIAPKPKNHPRASHAPLFSDGLNTTRWHVRCSRRPEKRTWPARGWFFGSGALGKIGDLLQALLAVWEKDVVGKVAGGECFLTTIRLTGKRFLTTIRPIGKLWGLGKVTGMKHGHRKVSRN